MNVIAPRNHPVAIGGVGGSGTRLVAGLFQKAGYYIGSDLNQALDNKWFSFLFRRPEILDLDEAEIAFRLKVLIARLTNQGHDDQASEELIRQLSEYPLHPFDDAWTQSCATTLSTMDDGLIYPYDWGWKEPNTHLLLDHLMKVIPDIRYIHVMRNGLDMAFSQNQNQARLWGPHFLGEKYEETPAYSLKYWCAVHERVFRYARCYPDRVYILNYDLLCESPRNEIASLLDFTGQKYDHVLLTELMPLVKKPTSVGRFKSYGLSGFDLADVEFVKNLGFDVEQV